MKKLERLVLLFVLCCGIVTLCITAIILSRQETVQQSHAPRTLLLVLTEKDEGGITPFGWGTAVLINREQGYMVTTRHITRYLTENPGYGLHVEIGGTMYPVERIWEHRTADIAVVGFLRNKKPPLLPEAFIVGKKLPAIHERVVARGYHHTMKSAAQACEKSKEVWFCEKNLSLTIELPDAPMLAISPELDVEQLTAVNIANEKYPSLALQYEDVFFDHHITGIPDTPNFIHGKEYAGMSGGVLQNKEGHVLGILSAWAAASGYIWFVPTREIPDEYLPRPAQ